MGERCVLDEPGRMAQALGAAHVDRLRTETGRRLAGVTGHARSCSMA